MSEKGNKIISLRFNHSNTLLYISTTQGFRVYRLEDSKIISRRDRILSINFIGGFNFAVPLCDSQKVGLVGSPENPKFPLNVLNIWDEYQAKFLKNIDFHEQIVNLAVRRNVIAVVLISSVQLVDTAKFEVIEKIEKQENALGCFAMSKDGPIVLAFPGSHQGDVVVRNLGDGSYTEKKVHENSITCLSLNNLGTIGASASEYGTIIRVFTTNSITILQELRRGSLSAQILSLNFSPSSHYLACCSTKKTIHIFNIQNDPTLISPWLPKMFQLSKSQLQISLNPDISWTCEYSQPGASICFTEDECVYVAGLDGKVTCYELSNEQLTLKSSNWYLDFEEELVEDECEWTSLE